jgi:hypothetical protein
MRVALLEIRMSGVVVIVMPVVPPQISMSNLRVAGMNALVPHVLVSVGSASADASRTPGSAPGTRSFMSGSGALLGADSRSTSFAGFEYAIATSTRPEGAAFGIIKRRLCGFVAEKAMSYERPSPTVVWKVERRSRQAYPKHQPWSMPPL